MTESAKKLGGAWSGNGLGLPCIQKKMKISLYLCLLQDFKPACIQGGKLHVPMVELLVVMKDVIWCWQSGIGGLDCWTGTLEQNT